MKESNAGEPLELTRTQLPVFSPLTAQAVWAGAGWSSPSGLLERILAHTGATAALLADSGTSALRAAIATAALRRPGRPVALPGYGCFDLITAARGAGVRILLYDVDPATLQPDRGSLSIVLAEEPSAVVFVHHYGVPVRITDWADDVHRAGALVIEDAAQGVGARVDGLAVGTAGDVGILSFGRGKGITAGGGGALLFGTRSPLRSSLKELVGPPSPWSAIFVAKLAAQWLLGRPSLYGVPSRLPFLGLGETRYRSPEPVRAMTPQMARVLAITLSLAAGETAARQRNADAIISRLSANAAARVPALSPGAEAGWLRLPFRAEGASAGDRLGCVRGYPISLRNLPECRVVLEGNPRTPGADNLAKALWTVPVHSQLTDRDVAHTVRWMESSAG